MFVLETPRLLLRPISRDDAPSVFEYAKNPNITKFVPWQTHKSIDDSYEFIEDAVRKNEEFPCSVLSISQKINPTVIMGTVGLGQGKHDQERALAYVIGEDFWRQGFTFEACTYLIAEGFQNYGLKRIYAWAASGNTPSKNLLLKLGMQHEGCLRSRELLKGELHDADYYSILLNEWETNR